MSPSTATHGEQGKQGEQEQRQKKKSKRGERRLGWGGEKEKEREKERERERKKTLQTKSHPSRHLLALLMSVLIPCSYMCVIAPESDFPMSLSRHGKHPLKRLPKKTRNKHTHTHTTRREREGERAGRMHGHGSAPSNEGMSGVLSPPACSAGGVSGSGSAFLLLLSPSQAGVRRGSVLSIS